MEEEIQASVVRRCGRGRVRIAIEVDAVSDHNLWCGLSSDLKDGGLFVATHEALEPGTQVELSLQLPGSSAPMALRGIVRWTRAYREESDGPAGVGVKFLAIDPDTALHLSGFASVREPILFELDEPPSRTARTRSRH